MSKEFWTDETVREFIQWGRRKHHISDQDILQLDIEAFKASKSIPEDKKDWEIVGMTGNYWGDKDVLFVHTGADKFAPKKEVDHFCVGWRNPPELILHQFDRLVKEGFKIHSVKRLSDGKVFTVGDKTNYGTIIRFYIKNGHMLADRDLPDYGVSIRILEKVVDNPVLFLSEDKVGIKEGDTFWYVKTKGRLGSDAWTPQMSYAAKYENYVSDWKLFSTIEAANSFILLNKPVFSVQEIMNTFQLYFRHPDSAFATAKHMARKKI